MHLALSQYVCVLHGHINQLLAIGYTRLVVKSHSVTKRLSLSCGEQKRFSQHRGDKLK